MLAPRLFSDECTYSVKAWKAHNTANLKINEFGSGYKKLDSYKADGRGQSPIVPKQGLEQASAMFAQLFPSKRIADISKVPAGANFMANAWYFGFAPEMDTAVLTPNSGAVVRVMAVGTLKAILLNTSLFTKALPEEERTALTLEALLQRVLKLNEAGFSKLDGVQAHYCSLGPGDVLYIPQGWTCVEKAAEGQLLYGVRKSYMVAAAAAIESYESTVHLLRQSSRDVSRMEAIAEVLNDANCD